MPNLSEMSESSSISVSSPTCLSPSLLPTRCMPSYPVISSLKIAALFVQGDGCYAGLPFVDPWHQERDARNYTGPLPVVAHPPCQLWGAMAAVNYARWGGEHNRPGNDGGCFASAIKAVRKWGGVLEHPAATRAWTAHNLTPPVTMGWQRTMEGDWVCEVWQSAYGHRANKATWLLYHGVNSPMELRWKRIVGTHQIGRQDQRGKARNKPTLGPRESSATPELFRDALIALASECQRIADETADETSGRSAYNAKSAATQT
jgi:hypothetical protein